MKRKRGQTQRLISGCSLMVCRQSALINNVAAGLVATRNRATITPANGERCTTPSIAEARLWSLERLQLPYLTKSCSSEIHASLRPLVRMGRFRPNTSMLETPFGSLDSYMPVVGEKSRKSKGSSSVGLIRSGFASKLRGKQFLCTFFLSLTPV